MDVEFYTRADQLTPMLPAAYQRGKVLEKVQRLRELSLGLEMSARQPVAEALAPKLRVMNSYYTHKIEGDHTKPLDLERHLNRLRVRPAGLHDEKTANKQSAESAARLMFSSPDVDSALQRKLVTAEAYLHTEQWALAHFKNTAWPELVAPATLQSLHQHMFDQLPEAYCLVPRLRPGGDDEVMLPGALRKSGQEVTVGAHLAPQASELPMFLNFFAQEYGRINDPNERVLAAIAAHHKLAWIHPFLDGNGRAIRLHTHLLLHHLGLSGGGLWSSLRGLARDERGYRAALRQADEPRQGDLDGRGNLSEKYLLAFIEYFLDVCIDQVKFMQDMLRPSTLPDRVRNYLLVRSHELGYKNLPKAAYGLLHMLAFEPLERGEFKTLTGLQATAGERLIRTLLEEGIVRSDSPRAKLHFAIPSRALRYYFPALWIEAEADYDT